MKKSKIQESFLSHFKPGLEKIGNQHQHNSNQHNNHNSHNHSHQYNSHNQPNSSFDPEGPEGSEKPMQSYSPLNFEMVKERERIDQQMGFYTLTEGDPKLGWLINVHDTLIDDGSCPEGHSAVDLYFLQDDGSSFKATILYEPYFYIRCLPGSEPDVEEYIKRKFSRNILSVNIVEKEDLTLPNHLTGIKCKVLKVVFFNNDSFKSVKNSLNSIIENNSKRAAKTSSSLDGMFGLGDFAATSSSSVSKAKSTIEAATCIIELREHDVSYYSRVMIDRDLRVGLWYNVRPVKGVIILEPRQDITLRPDPVVFAFDIETTKLPLRFPDVAFDSIIMISYMIDGQGFLITNREIVSKDIDDFDYNPKPEYQGEFKIFNEPNEISVLKRFFDHIRAVKPTIFVTYNGDFFDWHFIDKRSAIHGLSMAKEIGVSKTLSGEYLSSYGSHMDCFMWVKRDSYLPQGSQNLKAVAKYKLGYDPVELDPEDMTRFASEHPQILSQYSVSDAVATYYLYMKYVHPFTFSLCNIIPMHPDDVLRRGSGTLCEHLLMVQAFKANVLMPNKHVDKGGNFFNGHMLNSETYVGGHVEALEAGVFRSDIPTKFNLSPDAFQQLIDEIDNALKFTITKEGKHQLDKVLNYDEVKAQIVGDLERLRDEPLREECPSIYHLDVGAMYPNIILTNRLQPDAIVDETVCASCDFNEGPDSACQRKMPWSWRGEYFMANKGDYNMIRNQLEQEKFPGRKPELPMRAFHELPHSEQEALVKKRMGEYTQKIYGKKFGTKVVEKESIVCQRENPFYVNTVRDFRDRRYEYKALLKQWKKKLEQATKIDDASAIYEASKMTVIYDSLQTAHKCILNSFYGYVMRKAARWYSMEMAGIVCLTGAKIIQLARQRVEKIGKPLELDTDGIWCVLPASFPENFSFQLEGGKSYTISYPCVMLNHLVHDQFTNHQYQELVDPTSLEYSTRSENSIFFEVDGPYKAMILPASQEEGKLLKKRYAVFNHDGTIAELKGFELKRRGELKLIKNFQSSIFKMFLEGETLEECYGAVASVANRWLDIIYSKGADLTDQELFDLVSENRSMSKSLEEYGAQKSTSITTAKRLAEFLGEQMVQEKGLNCHFIITTKPLGAPVNERAIPIAIFQSEQSVKKHFLRKWLKDNSLDDDDIRDLIDWEYYLERFGGTIQKLITIPAALQGLPNPIPRIVHPEWVTKRISRDKYRQRVITDIFKPAEPKPIQEYDKENPTEVAEKPIVDLEDIGKPKVVRLPNGKKRLMTKEALLSIKNEKPKKTVKKKKAKKVSPTPLQNPHDALTDYVNWLGVQKEIWAGMQKNNRQLGNAPKRGIGNFFQSSASLLANRTWELLQVSETDSLGIFRVWAIINDTLESIDIEVPRIFYVNSRVPATGFDSNEIEVTQLSRTLPRNHQCLYFYELKMSEYYYRRQASLFSSMFNHKDIEGVYETQVPLLFRALTKLGAFGSTKLPSHQIDRTKPLKLADMEQAQRPSNLYLSKGSFSTIFLFHANTSTREFIGVFNPYAETLNIYIVDAGLNRDAVPATKRLYNEARTAFLESLDSSFFEFPEKIESNSSVVESEKEAFALLNRYLLGLKSSQGRKAHILVVQSMKSLKYYRNSGIAAFREYPTLKVASHKSDSAFPAIGWQKYALERMLQQVFHLPAFLDQRINLARYANVPVCNIENDFTLFLSDLFLARRLKQVENIWWCSQSSRPDLGGSENEDNSFSDLKCPEINVPSTHNSICIELNIWDLPLNTIIRSHDYSNDIDQLAASTTSKGSIHLVDSHFATKKDQTIQYMEQESPHYAFVALRSMIKDWTKELKNGNVYAGHMLDHLHRWLTTTSSYFYDGMVVIQIHNMMKRTLAAIIDELRRLGSQIVYASFEKIVIATSKTSLSAGSGYIAYVTAALRRNPSFEHIELHPSVFWDYLVWYDPFNFASIVYQNNAGGNEITDGAEMEKTISLHWHISEFLPAPVQQTFLSVVAELLDAIGQLKDQCGDKEKFITQLRLFLGKDMKHQMFNIVKDIQKHRIPQGADLENHETHPFAFPKLPGSCRVMSNPALEFIKMICMVLNLNTDLDNQVRSMRKDMLRLIDILEFNKDAKFSNPCEKYLLPQVICHYCNFGCDLDLTRKQGQSDENSESFLVCEKCFGLYDRDDIEQRLVLDLEGLLSRWQLQDLRCKTCGLVKAEELRDKCAKCTGVLESVLDGDQFERQLSVLSNLANFFRMPTLQEATEFTKSLII